MSATLADIATLWATLGKLGPTKTHLFRAGREILMAVESILKVAEDYLGAVPLSSDKKSISEFFLATCQRVVKGLAAPLEPETDDEARAVHDRVLDSIIGVLNEELGRLATATKTTPADRVKLQALTSIRETLDRQRNRREPSPDEVEITPEPIRRRRRDHATRGRFEKNAHR